jgi:alkyl hydroperoxide reductase subunit AhpC
MSRLLGLGERFPEFSMHACVSTEPGSEFRIIDSHNLEGKWAAIFFWPLDFTFVCPTELVEFDRSLPQFRALQYQGVRREWGQPLRSPGVAQREPDPSQS